MVWLLGLALLALAGRPGKPLRQASYDWLFELSPQSAPPPQATNVVLIYLDEASHKELSQPFNQAWDRALYARLLHRLTIDGARAVVFDVIFSDPGPSSAGDEALAKAIRENGRVILAVDRVSSSPLWSGSDLAVETTVTEPWAPFRKAAAGFGFAQIQADEDFMARRHFHGYRGEETYSLSWATAKLASARITQSPEERFRERWVNYYRGGDTIPYVSYRLAETRPPGFFRDKVVFIGARPGTRLWRERRDEFRSPYSSWYVRPQFIPAVELHATMFLNLVSQDWLRRLTTPYEAAILLLTSVLAGYGLSRFTPAGATGMAMLGVMASIGAAVTAFVAGRWWFPWLIVAGAQIPCGWVWHVSWRSVEWYVQKRRLEAQRRQAEERIHEQAALLDQARDAIIVHGLDWRVSYWNKSAERVYGWTAKEAESERLDQRILKAEAGQVQEARRKTLTEGAWNGELLQTTRAGATITVESRWTLLRDEQGEPKSILVINTDITEQKRLEHQFLRAQRVHSIGTLAGGIAHDLNNVLTPIFVAVDLVLKAPVTAAQKHMLGVVSDSARRGADLVKQVLMFAQGRKGGRAEVRLSHLIRELEKMLRETFPRSILLSTRVDTDLWATSGDATQLHQVLLNLCVNARDAMPEGGELLIEAGNHALDEPIKVGNEVLKPGRYLRLRVADSGTGMSPETMRRMFEPFYTTKGLGKGTGLGLSTSLTIVKNHRGVLDCQSEIGDGTTFSIFLPASEEEERSSTESSPPLDLRGNGETILVVDDEAAIIDTVRPALLANGYRVITAVNGAEAVMLFAHNGKNIAAALVDVVMPGMGGPTTIRTLRRLRPDLCCIAMSGLQAEGRVREQIGSDEFGFLAKPFDVDRLLRILRDALNGKPKAVADEVQHGSPGGQL